MPVKTITAEIDGKVREIKADIPDDATEQELHDAVRTHLASQPVVAKPSRKDSLKGGPANMPDDAVNPAREGFWKSVGNMVTAPFNFAANLDTVTPKDILEGAGNTIVKVGSGNLLGAAGDIAGGALVAGALKGPPKALEAIEPAPLVPKAASGGGLISNVRGLFDIYKKVKKMSPTALGEAGFEKFLNFVEGQTEQPAKPKPPAAPVAEPYKPSSTAGSGSNGAASGSGNPSVDPSSETGGPAGSSSATAPKPSTNGKPAGQPPASDTADAGPRQTLQDSTPARTKGIGQAMKDAHAMRDKLSDWGFTPDEAKSMNEKSWAKLAADSNVPMPTTAAARNRVVFELQKKMQGVARSVDEMLAVFKR